MKNVGDSSLFKVTFFKSLYDSSPISDITRLIDVSFGFPLPGFPSILPSIVVIRALLIMRWPIHFFLLSTVVYHINLFLLFSDILLHWWLDRSKVLLKRFASTTFQKFLLFFCKLLNSFTFQLHIVQHFIYCICGKQFFHFVKYLFGLLLHNN